MRVVLALGGNALLHRGERPDAEPQRRNVVQAVASLAPLTRAHELVITHGNGPQVGVLAMESAADTSLSRPFPLDPLGAAGRATRSSRPGRIRPGSRTMSGTAIQERIGAPSPIFPSSSNSLRT